MLRKTRILVQSIFFAVFVILLFAINNQQFAGKFQTEIFLQVNPLVALLTSIASRTVIMVLIPGAITVLVITLLFGRVFCGWVCPLGAAIDFCDKFVIGKARNISRRLPVYVQRLKYVILIVLLIAAMLGFLFPLIMDPISIATRISSILIMPVFNLLETTMTNAMHIFTKGSKATAWETTITGVTGALITSILVFAGGFWDKRFWCQYICPTGAFLGLLSRFSLLRRMTVEQKCNNCKACSTRQCPVRAINHENVKLTSTSECIICGVCASNKRSCTQFAFKTGSDVPVHSTVLARRHFVTGILAGVFTPAIIAGSGVTRAIQTQPVRPPGSLPEDEFLKRCIACGQCMKVCPEHALQPCGFFDGLTKVNTPYLAPEIGSCEKDCVACTNVCPTVAIRPVNIDDKPYVKIGTAIVDKNLCLAWKGEIKCLVCKRKCPYQAISVQDLEFGEILMSGPVIDKDLCTGCGICETRCASHPLRAIRVSSYGERRVSSGPFISEKKKERILQGRLEIIADSIEQQ